MWSEIAWQIICRYAAGCERARPPGHKELIPWDPHFSADDLPQSIRASVLLAAFQPQAGRWGAGGLKAFGV